MAERKSMSKRLRFEIFKRDGYRCRYCGSTPAVSILRVDHVVPVVGGGSDDPENLVTSCEPCNAGKGPVPLDDRRLPDTMSAEDARERADQLREYTAAQRDVLTARNELVDVVAESWRRHFGGDDLPSGLTARLRGPLSEFSLEQIDEAVQIVAQHPDFGAGWEPRPSTQMSRRMYLLGILRNWREARAEPPRPTPTPVATTSPHDTAMCVLREMFDLNRRQVRVLIACSFLARDGSLDLVEGDIAQQQRVVDFAIPECSDDLDYGYEMFVDEIMRLASRKLVQIHHDALGLGSYRVTLGPRLIAGDSPASNGGPNGG